MRDTNPKMKEVLRRDFFSLTPLLINLPGYERLLLLPRRKLGLAWMEAAYHHLTYDLTVHAAEIVLSKNPGMTFVYVSGAGTEQHGERKDHVGAKETKRRIKILNLGFSRPLHSDPAL